MANLSNVFSCIVIDKLLTPRDPQSSDNYRKNSVRHKHLFNSLMYFSILYPSPKAHECDLQDYLRSVGYKTCNFFSHDSMPLLRTNFLKATLHQLTSMQGFGFILLVLCLTFWVRDPKYSLHSVAPELLCKEMKSKQSCLSSW